MEKKRKKKIVHPLRAVGWEQIEIPSHMLDSMWEKDGTYKIIFATGQTATIGALENVDVPEDDTTEGCDVCRRPLLACKCD